MLQYILKILMREYATYVLMVILMVNSLYAIYFANTSQMVIESTTYYYLSSYRPHVVLFLTAPLYSLDENVSVSLNKLVLVNESVHNLIKYYKELDASTLFCIYRFSINGTSFRLFIGKTDSLEEFGFNTRGVPSNDRSYLYILRGDINTTADIIRKLVSDENIEFYPLSYTAYNYPLDTGSSSIDLFIPISNLTSALHNQYLEEIIRNTWNNSQVVYRSVVGYTYISLNFIDIELVRNCMDSPQLVLQKITPIMTEFVDKLGKTINYRIHYGFMITNQHSSRGEINESGQYSGELMVKREDIARLLLSVNNVVASFLSRNIDILIISYVPIGIFLVSITSRLKRILFDNVLSILVTRGFDKRKISLYSLVSLILILLITLLIIDFIMLHALHVNTKTILLYSLAMIIVFTTVYSISSHSGSRLSKQLLYIFSALFIVYVAMGYLRLSITIVALSCKYLLVPLAIVISLLPLYAVFLPYMLYTLYSKALSFVEKKLVEHIYMLRSMKRYGVILFTSIYSLTIIILISLSPITTTYNYISADPGYVSALGYEKLTELGILDNWMSSQYMLFSSIFVTTSVASLFLLLRDIYKLLRYAKIRGLDKGFIYKRIFGSSLFILMLIVLFTSIMFLVLILFFDAHIGLFYSAVRTSIVYDPNTRAPRVTIEEVFVPKHLWEGLI